MEIPELVLQLQMNYGITVQGLETIHHNGNDKIVLKRLEEIVNEYEIEHL